MEARELVRSVEENFPDAVVSAGDERAFPYVQIKPGSLKSVLSYFLHDPKMRFDYLECITGVDTGDEFFIIYHLCSTSLVHRTHVKVSVDKHKPKIITATGFWKAASVYEMEIAEMLGVEFDGLQNVRGLFLPEDWHGYPLRKDYIFPDDYHGIEHRREPLRKEHVRP